MLSSPEVVKSGFNLSERVLLSEAEFEQLMELFRSGSDQAKDALINLNLGLVMSIAQRFVGRGETDDLFQIGCLGLMKAVERFDPSYGVKFSTYAVPLIIGEIKQYLRDDGLMKVSRGIKEIAYRIEQSRAGLIVELGREPTLTELAANSGLSREEIAEALEAVQPVASIHESVTGSDSADAISREELIGDEKEQNQWWERYVLYEGLAELPERLQLLIELRFFQEKTQMEVAQLFGVSQVQICRLEKNALNQLRGFYQNDA
ncbi:MAG: SigB/SigF/SigG family RNA polymerase sigma factor [Bacillota bacterium]|jgi:RNA polymerase sporulation-specific sigma factor